MGSPPVWHEYHIGKDVLPPQCCVCMEDLSNLSESQRDQQSFALLMGHDNELSVARCAQCIRNSRGRAWVIWFGVLVVTMGVGAGSLLLFRLEPEFYYLFLGLYAMLALAIASYVTSSLTSPMQVKTLSPGTLGLCFPNPKYCPVPNYAMEHLIAGLGARDNTASSTTTRPKSKRRRPADATSLKIRGLDDITFQELQEEIENGAKFVSYSYCTSLAILTLKRTSDIYFIRSNQSRITPGLRYTVRTLLAGWWGIPWGPIFTISSLGVNFSGGNDMTQEVLQSFNQRSFARGPD